MTAIRSQARARALAVLATVMIVAVLSAGGAVAAQTVDGPTVTVPSADRPVGEPAPLISSSVDDDYIVILADDRLDPAIDRRSARSRNADAVIGAGRVPDGAVTHRFDAAIGGFSARLTPEQLDRIRADGRVAFVEANGRMTIEVDQNDAPWALDRIDQADLPLDDTFTYGPTGAGVTVYVIDTGVEFIADLSGRVSSRVNFVSGESSPADCEGHGTVVASNVAGTTYGVAKSADIVGVRVLGCDGTGSYADVIAGIDWVTANATGQAVANLSLGGPASSSVDAAINALHASGVPVAVAAGNDAADACTQSPARVSSAMTLGGSDIGDRRYTSSNHGSCVDLNAPAVDVPGMSRGNAVVAATGTSFASPLAAGVMAQLVEQSPAAAPDAIYSQLLAMTESGTLTNLVSGTPNLLLQAVTEEPGGNDVLTCSATVSGSTLSVSWDAVDGARAYSVSRRFGNGNAYLYLGWLTGTSLTTDLPDGTGQVIQARVVFADGSVGDNVECGVVDVGGGNDVLSCTATVAGATLTVEIVAIDDAVAYSVSRRFGNGHAYLYLGYQVGTTLVTELPAGTGQIIQVKAVLSDGSRTENVQCGTVDV